MIARMISSVLDDVLKALEKLFFRWAAHFDEVSPD